MYYLNTKGPLILYGETLNSEIYVDKSLLIEEVSGRIKSGNKYICITRPRRFGKTVNANMLGAYYTKGYDSSRLFEGRAICKTESYRDHLNQHNVIYMDLSRMPDLCRDYREYLSSILKKMKADLAEAYPELAGREYDSLSQMFQDTGDSCLSLTNGIRFFTGNSCLMMTRMPICFS